MEQTEKAMLANGKTFVRNRRDETKDVQLDSTPIKSCEEVTLKNRNSRRLKMEKVLFCQHPGSKSHVRVLHLDWCVAKPRPLVAERIGYNRLSIMKILRFWNCTNGKTCSFMPWQELKNIIRRRKEDRWARVLDIDKNSPDSEYEMDRKLLEHIADSSDRERNEVILEQYGNSVQKKYCPENQGEVNYTSKSKY